MNLDFHYYGTYYAARLAGFPAAEAEIIAYYAQFVDECTQTLLTKHVKASEIGGLKPVPTVQSDAEISSIAKSMRRFTADEKREVTKIWSTYHFLPGNINTDIPYNGVEESEGKIDNWKYDGHAREEFKLLCLPNSDCVIEMVEKLRHDYTHAKGQGKSRNELEHIGLVMHVLADTWAHCWFAGTPAWFINEVGNSVYEVDDSGKKKKLTYIYDPVFSDSIYWNKYTCVPEAPRFDGIFELGHGRIGHIPDYGFMTYEYTPAWDSEKDGERRKCNPDFFMDAFRQMVYAMACVYSDQEFRHSQYAALSAADRQLVASVLNTRKTDTKEEWENAVRTGLRASLKAFKADDSFQTYKSAANKMDTHLYRFLKAASEQLNLVENHHLF